MSGYSAERARILSGLERHIPSKSAPRPRSTLKKLNGSMRIPSVLLGVWSAIEFMQPFDLVLWALTVFSGLLIGIMYFGLLVIVASIGDSQDGADSFFPRLLGLFGVNFELPVLQTSEMNHWCQRDADLNKYCQSWLKSNGGYALGTREYYLMRRTARELNLLDHTILEQHEVPLKQTSP